jgi:O-6-methylguanine DNA methyltransferase
MQQQNDFFERVYEVVRQIPYGKVTTYGTIAKYLGAAKSARTVGYAMNAAHAKPNVPAHRVVNRIGKPYWETSFWRYQYHAAIVRGRGPSNCQRSNPKFRCCFLEPKHIALVFTRYVIFVNLFRLNENYTPCN